MTWYRTHRIPFQSRTGKQYVAFIRQDLETEPETVTLTAGPEPFVTQEDDANDIFKPIRGQTGYLRVIDESGGTLLSDLVPNNNTEKAVQLWEGTYENGEFVFGTIRWQGYLCAEAFTQPWDGQKNIIEIPVKSPLAALADIHIDSSMAAKESRVAELIEIIREKLETSQSPWTQIIDATDINALNESYGEGSWLRQYIQWSVFFKQKTTTTVDGVLTSLEGVSYHDALSAVLSLFGLTARENGEKLYFVQYDYRISQVMVHFYDITTFLAMAYNDTYTPPSGRQLDEGELLQGLSFRGTQNTQAYLQGGNAAEVTLNIGGEQVELNLPDTPEDASNVVNFALHQGILYVQLHEPQSGANYTCSFYYYNKRNLQGTSTYAIITSTNPANLCLLGATFDPYAITGTYLYTGAFPVRWFHQRDSETVELKTGIYMSTQYWKSGMSALSYGYAFSIDSLSSVTAYGGWLHLDFSLQTLIFKTTNQLWYFNEYPDYAVRARAYVAICLENENYRYYWDNANGQWVRMSIDTPPHDYVFAINLQNGSVISNKTSEIPVGPDSGLFLPLGASNISGVVKVFFMNAVAVETVENNPVYLYGHEHILSDLSVRYYAPRSITNSSRSNNTYRQLISNTGFSDEKTITLSMGTMNNNDPSPCFLRRSVDRYSYLTTLAYYPRAGSDYIWQRPEEHLLSRLAEHNRSVKRTMKVVVATGRELYVARYQDSASRKYFGVCSKRDWREEEEILKFIEV